ncbi:MAG TPA: erythromycin esterase family protein [Flavobacterium sp.]|jgi:erythromycin esterase-like protein
MPKLKKVPVFIALAIVTGCNTASQKSDISASIPSHPLEDSPDLDVLVDRIGDSRVVLLGEASHGTAEYYDWRAEITKRLIAEKGFTIIGVEGEWADSYRVNQFVKGPLRDAAAAESVLRYYDRWPTWMWANYHIAELTTWLNNYNHGKADKQKAGFYGLDVYCLWESMGELMPYIKDDPKLTQMAQEVNNCFRPYSADPIQYSVALAGASPTCSAQTQAVYQAVMNRTQNKTASTEADFVMQQNALVALNAESYFRAVIKSDVQSWNIRDRHMMQTIKRLLDFHGPGSKMIIWEHNTHVGDARYTDMAAGGMVNVGQLVREEYGRENVFIVGFGSYRGKVIAAESWGAKVRTMTVPRARKDSWEELLHRGGEHDRMLFSDEIRKIPQLMKPMGHRAIGVQYNPFYESGNYVPTIIPDRYDAFLFIDETSALRPIEIDARNEPPDTYPSGY